MCFFFVCFYVKKYIQVLDNIPDVQWFWYHALVGEQSS